MVSGEAVYSRELGEVLVRLLDVGGGALHHKVVKRPPVVGNLHSDNSQGHTGGHRMCEAVPQLTLGVLTLSTDDFILFRQYHPVRGAGYFIQELSNSPCQNISGRSCAGVPPAP